MSRRPPRLALPLALAGALALGPIACGAPTDRDGAADAGPADGGDADAGPDAGPSDPATLRLATYNVHLFFDPTCDSGRCGPDDFEQAPTEAEFEARADRIAGSIRRLDATVACLQEIETQTGLDALQARLRDTLPESILGEVGYAGSVDVAVMSRAPILSVRRHHDEVLTRPDGSETTFSRELLEVHVGVDGRHVVVFCAHFRSKANDDPGRRLAEAAATAELAAASAAEFPDALVLVAGDLNDVPGSETLQALEAPGRLVSAGSALGPDGWTYLWDGTHQLIDHLYYDPAGGALEPGTVEVVRDSSRGLGDSDHAALVAGFRVGDAP